MSVANTASSWDGQGSHIGFCTSITELRIVVAGSRGAYFEYLRSVRNVTVGRIAC